MIALFPRFRKQSTLQPGSYVCSYTANGSRVAERVEVIRQTRTGYLVVAKHATAGYIRQRLTFKQVETANWKAIS